MENIQVFSDGVRNVAEQKRAFGQCYLLEDRRFIYDAILNRIPKQIQYNHCKFFQGLSQKSCQNSKYSKNFRGSLHILYSLCLTKPNPVLTEMYFHYKKKQLLLSNLYVAVYFLVAFLELFCFHTVVLILSLLTFWQNTVFIIYCLLLFLYAEHSTTVFIFYLILFMFLHSTKDLRKLRFVVQQKMIQTSFSDVIWLLENCHFHFK